MELIEHLSECVESMCDVDLHLIQRLNKSAPHEPLILDNADSLFLATSLEFLNALAANNESVKVLLNHVKEDPSLEHSVGLILRNNLALSLRFLSFSYILNTEGKTALLKELYAYNADPFGRMEKHIKVLKELGHPKVAEEEVAEVVSKALNNNPGLNTVVQGWRGTGGERPETMLAIFKALKRQDKADDENRIERFSSAAMIYDVWEYYSKYEHLTIFTRELKNKDNFEQSIRRIGQVMEVTCLALSLIASATSNKDLSQHYQEIENSLIALDDLVAV